MELRLDPLPTGSLAVRGWLGEYGDDIDFTALLTPVSNEVVEIRSAHGKMPVEIAAELCKQVKELGYKKMTFFRTAGGPASRYAKYVGTFDHYEVDLSDGASTD